jgi:oligoendopeptidase F
VVNINPQDWNTIGPAFDALEQENLTPERVPDWLLRWSTLEKTLAEANSALYRTMTENTLDETAERAYLNFNDSIVPPWKIADDRLKKKLLTVEDYAPPADQVVMMRRLRTEAALFREANVPLETELTHLSAEYDKIVGAMTVTLDGTELTMHQAMARLLWADRGKREQAWRACSGRWLEDQSRLDTLFLRMLGLRRSLARNAGFANYRDYAWQALARFDYTPEDCKTFHDAIEAEVVPLATRFLEEDRQALGLNAMRPWDFDWRHPLDPMGREPLKPFSNPKELEEGAQRVFNAIDPQLGTQFSRMRQGWLDLGTRKGKAPGGYCEYFAVSGSPYIFMSAVGTHDDVNTLLHEGGHAFHAFAFGAAQPLVWNHWSPMEFAEVGSMAMELLAHPYLERDRGGFYSPDDARRARTQHLRGIVRFLPYMAIVDAFQHWLYTEAPENVSAHDLNANWVRLWDRFSPGVDWTGLEDVKHARWHWQGHLFGSPFYYVEYGMAQLGALQVWQNALHDQSRALEQYKHALSLGYTRSIRALFQAAGARFAFDREMVGGLMKLVSSQLGA